MTNLLTTVFYGLAASLFWGSGDFSGGLASRHAKAASVVFAAYTVGCVFLVGLAVAFGEPFPQPADFLWGGLAGIAGVIGLVAFYSALAGGKMGLAAPIAGALTAIIPVIFSISTSGLPHPLQLGGFLLALCAIVLIARPERSEAGAGRGVWLALLAGCGFGLFFIFISRVSPATTFGSLAIARGAAVCALLVWRLFRPVPLNPGMRVLPLVVLAGALDALGNVFFLLAAHSGRLDVAAIVSSLYPAATVLLAALVLRERVQRLQGLGVLLALVAIPLISA